MAETSFLPLDIIQIILSRLLFVKALLRFKSVSKSWNSIISDPIFVKNHHRQQSKTSQDLFVRRVPISGEFTLVKLEDKKLEIVQVLESPYNCKYVLCSYGGVLLLTDFDTIEVMLWNPSTRTHREIWIPFQQRFFGSSYGLCPDPTTDSFKVVVVNRYNYSVYSVKTKSLIIDTKKFDGLYTDYGLIYSNKAVCVDGAVYWALGWNGERIIYFDPRDDKFKVLQKPEYVKPGKRILLVDLRGSLCLCCEGEDKTTIKIWIKKKGIDNYSWKILISVEDVKMGIESFEPQCIVGNKIVTRDRYHFDLAVYSPLEKTFEQFRDTASSSGLVPYVDSPLVETRGKSKRKRL